MSSLDSSKRSRAHVKETKRFNSVKKRIELLEKKIRTRYEVGDIKVRTTGKVSQLIWKRVDFLEFDQRWLPSMNLNSTKPKLDLKFFPESPFSKKRAIYPGGKGFLYCSYKYASVESQKN